MLFMLCCLIVLQYLTVCRQNRQLSRQRRIIRQLLQQRRVWSIKAQRLRKLADNPYCNAIRGWLALQQVVKTLPDGEVYRALWQGMDSLKAVIRLTPADYTQAERTAFSRVAGIPMGGK